jgi:transcriptional regulator with XRE-family HTH domain
MGNILANWIRDNGKTIPGLAAECEITRTGMWKIVNGKRKPSVPLLHKISRATGIPKEKLRPDLYPEAQ